MTRRDPITDVPARRALLALLAVVVAGCGDGLCHQDDVAEIAVPAGSRLNAVDLGYSQAHLAEGSMVAVGDDALVLVASGGYALTEHRPVAVDLRAVAFGPGSQIFAAGAGGTLIRGQLGESTWQTVATGTTADLWRIAWRRAGPAGPGGAPTREYVPAVGDGAVLVRDPVDAQWDLVPPPEGGWGRLRAIAGDDRIHVGGLGGVVWSTDGPRGTWTRQDAGTHRGLPNVGKSTLFNALTKAGIAAENYPFCTIEPNVGLVELPDPRLGPPAGDRGRRPDPRRRARRRRVAARRPAGHMDAPGRRHRRRPARRRHRVVR